MPIRRIVVLGAMGATAYGIGTRELLGARTAEAPATILRADTGRMYEAQISRAEQPIRHTVVWKFEADGKTYVDSTGLALYLADRKYKVCFDPEDPANSSILEAELTCGKWSGF